MILFLIVSALAKCANRQEQVHCSLYSSRANVSTFILYFFSLDIVMQTLLSIEVGYLSCGPYLQNIDFAQSLEINKLRRRNSIVLRTLACVCIRYDDYKLEMPRSSIVAPLQYTLIHWMVVHTLRQFSSNKVNYQEDSEEHLQHCLHSDEFVASLVENE